MDRMLIELIVEEAVEFMFGDWPEGHGIGSSDVSAVMNMIIPEVNGRSDIDLTELREMVNLQIARTTGE